MSDPDQNPHPHTQQSSPKFTVAFAAGDLISTNQHQSPSDSPEMNVTLGMVDTSVQARSVNTTPPSTKHSSSVVTDDSTTPSPSRFDGSSFALANRGPMNTSKRTLQTAFPVYSTPLYSHDLDRKRFAVGSVTSPSIGIPSICNTTHMTPSGMDTNHIRTTPSRIYSSSARLEHSGSPDTNPWSLQGIDTRSALAALSVAYSSLFRNQISSGSTVMPQLVSLPNPLRIPGPDTLSGMGKVGPVSDGSLTTGCTHTSPNNNAPLLISLSDTHGMDKFSHTKPGDKSAVITGKTSVAQSCSQSFPPAISNLLSDNLDCWQQFQQAAYANNLDPHFLALYSSAGCPFELSGSSRRKNATRETTSMLKAWLNEHRKNPYPTKGEKIMLALITKMSLTQVSTWFANARRRLKKENKVTWNVRNRTASEAGQDSIGDEDDDLVPEFEEILEMEKVDGFINDQKNITEELQSPYPHHGLPNYHPRSLSNAEHRWRNKCSTGTTGSSVDSDGKTTSRSRTFGPHNSAEDQQSKIWSLVEMAQNHTQNEMQSQSLRGNIELRSSTIHGAQRSFSNLDQGKSHNIPIKDMCTKMSVSQFKSRLPNFNTGRGPGSELDTHVPINSPPNISANLEPDPRGFPLLSPAALAMFCMYYQQQQEQQQQHHHQHQQQQQQLPRVEHHRTPSSEKANHLLGPTPNELGQAKLGTPGRYCHEKDSNQINMANNAVSAINAQCVSSSRWPLMNGYTVGQITRSQSDH